MVAFGYIEGDVDIDTLIVFQPPSTSIAVLHTDSTLTRSPQVFRALSFSHTLPSTGAPRASMRSRA